MWATLFYQVNGLKLMDVLVCRQLLDENEDGTSFSPTFHEGLLWQCTRRSAVPRPAHLLQTMVSHHCSGKWGSGKELLFRGAAGQFWVWFKQRHKIRTHWGQYNLYVPCDNDIAVPAGSVQVIPWNEAGSLGLQPQELRSFCVIPTSG